MNRITTVNAIILNAKREILVVRKQRYFLLPGGKPEANENSLETLTRELNEEVGVKLAEAEIFKEYNFEKALNENAPLRMIVYIASVIGLPTPSNEISEVVWLNKTKYQQGLDFPKQYWGIIFQDLKNAGVIGFS